MEKRAGASMFILFSKKEYLDFFLVHASLVCKFTVFAPVEEMNLIGAN
jgi:hypothetical protein